MLSSGCSAIHPGVLTLNDLLLFMQIKPILAEDVNLFANHLYKICKCLNLCFIRIGSCLCCCVVHSIFCKVSRAVRTSTEPCYVRTSPDACWEDCEVKGTHVKNIVL